MYNVLLMRLIAWFHQHSLIAFQAAEWGRRRWLVRAVSQNHFVNLGSREWMVFGQVSLAALEKSWNQNIDLKLSHFFVGMNICIVLYCSNFLRIIYRNVCCGPLEVDIWFWSWNCGVRPGWLIAQRKGMLCWFLGYMNEWDCHDSLLSGIISLQATCHEATHMQEC